MCVTAIFHHLGAASGRDNMNDDELDEDSSDEDDYELRSTDAVLLAAKSQEDYSSLEVHVYNHEDGNFFVHHDIAMPTFPLCVEWLNFNTAGAVADAAGSLTGGGAAAGGAGEPHAAVAEGA